MAKSVLITAGADGTGLAISKKFASEGWTVYITSRSREKAAAAAGALRKEFAVKTAGFGVDMLSVSSMAELFRSLREESVILDSIVLNAVSVGKTKIVDPLECDIADWNEVVTTNVTGNFVLARESAKMMRDGAHGGTIVFISSNTSKEAIYSRSSYIASKGGVNALMRALAVDLGKYAIRVNCLLPGVIFNERIAAFPEDRLSLIRSRSPLRGGEWSTMEDIANGAFFLASSMSGNMTGSELLMDGGACVLLGADSTKFVRKE